MSTPSKVKLTNAAAVHSKTEDAENSAAAIENLISKSNLIHIANKNDFYNIIREIGDRIVLVEFFAHWCGPCQTLATKLEELANSYNGKILIIKVDVDEFEDIALEHDVSAMPTFVLMKNQKKLQQFSSSNIEILESTLEKFAGKPEIFKEEQREETVTKKEDAAKKLKRASNKAAAKN